MDLEVTTIKTKQRPSADWGIDNIIVINIDRVRSAIIDINKNGYCQYRYVYITDKI